eukprot:TRINITY_DN14838_c0_g1_i1.p1 TRINITY_DN14838_c0_g1~~TRINITY_DN14838_c0_g1_i1.p1  ORF type:complete len:534 (+),score=85.22 TRINITY_DN14838_c0_g1_i1:75-1676(+)
MPAWCSCSCSKNEPGEGDGSDVLDKVSGSEPLTEAFTDHAAAATKPIEDGLGASPKATPADARAGSPHAVATLSEWRIAPGFEGTWPERGWGVLRRSPSAEYRDHFCDGKPHGQGTYSFTCGDRYEGQVVNGRRHGSGLIRYADQTVYDGEWKDDVKYGEGKQRWPDGCTYDGQFQIVKHGAGKFYNPAGDLVYHGEFAHDKMEGYGIYEFANGRHYEGQWRSGRRDGNGIMIFPEGHEYAGQWKAGKQDGMGTITEQDGTQRRSAWRVGHELAKPAAQELTKREGPKANDFKPEQSAGLASQALGSQVLGSRVSLSSFKPRRLRGSLTFGNPLSEDATEKVLSAVRWAKPEEEIEAIIQRTGKGIDSAVKAYDKNTGNTALHIAAQNGHNDLVEFLVHHQADVNAQNKTGQTPLHMTVEYDMYFISLFLLRQGAEEWTLNHAGFKAITGINGEKAEQDSWNSPLNMLRGADDDAEHLAACLDAVEAALEVDPGQFRKSTLASVGLRKAKTCPQHWDKQRFRDILQKAVDKGI